MSTSIVFKELLASRGARWIAAGTAAFVGENLILSHNRTEIIKHFGPNVYHISYSALSTAAVGSVAWGYYKYKGAGQVLWDCSKLRVRLCSFSLLSLGLIGLSQMFPKLQIPFEVPMLTKEVETETTSQNIVHYSKKEGWFKPKCPFDFKADDVPSDGVYSLARVTRHANLWSLAFTGLGIAAITPFVADVVFLSSPTVIAATLGAHKDWRYRRNIGGYLAPEIDIVTSNIPFLAILQGNQSTLDVLQEIKGLNAFVAVCAAAILVARKRLKPNDLKNIVNLSAK